MPKKNDITEGLKEIKKAAAELAGWDNFRIEGIQKYGIEAVINTPQGSMKIPMKDIFLQPNFRMRIFETMGIVVPKTKPNTYEEWLAEWGKLIKDMGMEYGSSVDMMREALYEYIESAEERDISYLRKGTAIILPENCVAFRSSDFLIWAKKRNYGMSYNEDQIRPILKEIGCKPRQLGPTRIRVWTLVPPQIEPEGQTEFKFEKVGAAPDVMADDTAEVYDF